LDYIPSTIFFWDEYGLAPSRNTTSVDLMFSLPRFVVAAAGLGSGKTRGAATGRAIGGSALTNCNTGVYEVVDKTGICV